MKPDPRLRGERLIWQEKGTKRLTAYAEGLRNEAMGPPDGRPVLVAIVLTVEDHRVAFPIRSREAVDQICAELEALRDIVWPPN